MMGMCRSAVEGGQIALPLASAADEVAMLREAFGGKKVMLSMAGNAKEYGSSAG
jgi:hypothetical protein